MRFVSPALKHVVFPAMAGTGMLRRAAPRGVSIVTYHGVRPEGYRGLDPALDGNLVTAETLARQLRLLKAHYDVIEPETFRSWLKEGASLPERAILITCDDGLLNTLTGMLPVLQSEDLKCIFFVTGASAGATPVILWYERLLIAILRAPAGNFRIEGGGVVHQGVLGEPGQRRKLWWELVQDLSAHSAGERAEFIAAVEEAWNMQAWHTRTLELDTAAQQRFHLLTRSQLLLLKAAGMTIGAHTMTHPVLARQPLAMVREEIASSRKILENAIGTGIWALAYPFGDPSSVTEAIHAVAMECGFEAAFVNHGGGFSTNFNHFAIPRVHVTSTMALPEFEAHVAGVHSFLQRRARGRNQPALRAG